ncbi:GNAT family N-acetyltransferase [Kitasatospora herbaricolor]|uniref:GNAT family N-acetyltransferase n=1 Tax=Kitasatospora herbaricolor TaxID=68217 RepID=A0ABZ1W6V3_9ACTN|nr:GNAT family N-acetyltransferase [Kitasatospora herbaricolor]
MRELTTVTDLREAAEDDTLLLWAAQGFPPGTRAWTHDGAVAVAAPRLSCRDRLAVRGPAPAVTRLVRHAFAEAGPALRPVGDTPLLRQLITAAPGLALVDTFGWMEISGDRLDTSATATAHWLAPHELAEAGALVEDAHPTSYARPDSPSAGHARAHRWAGVRDTTGRLTALAADAWSAPEAGFLAGVAAHPVHGRGRGHAEAACRLVLDALLRRSGRAALMVDGGNTAAVRLYRRLGMRWRDVSAAALTG